MRRADKPGSDAIVGHTSGLNSRSSSPESAVSRRVPREPIIAGDRVAGPYQDVLLRDVSGFLRAGHDVVVGVAPIPFREPDALAADAVLGHERFEFGDSGIDSQRRRRKLGAIVQVSMHASDRLRAGAVRA